MPVKKSSQKRVYQFRVTLSDLRPPIWRRIQVTSNITLFDLHGILQTVMGWTNSHLHEFNAGGSIYGDAADLDEEVLDDNTVKLSRLITDEEAQFLYRYDLGDCWDHEIVVEKILPMAKGIKYPLCLAGERACPPEDCGGAPGYDRLLEILRDPSHPEHEDMFLWLPGDFDSEKFDVESVNRELRRLSRSKKSISATQA